jgi:hypothetical protein
VLGLQVAGDPIVFGSSITAPQMSQTAVSSGNGTQMTIQAQGSTDSGAYGGGLRLSSGDADNPGIMSFWLGSGEEAMAFYDSSSIGGAESQVVSYLPIFFPQTATSGHPSPIRFGFDNAHRLDSPSAFARSLVIGAESNIDSSSTAGDLSLQSGQGYDDSKTGSIFLTTGTTTALTLSPGGCHVFGSPSFAVNECSYWKDWTTASTSVVTFDIASISTNGAWRVRAELMASGGTVNGKEYIYYMHRDSGTLTLGTGASITDTLSPNPVFVLSKVNDSTIRFSLTPANATSTHWGLKVETRVL